MKHIALISQQYRTIRSGIGLHTELLAARLGQHGFRVTLIVPQEAGAPESASVPRMVRVPPSRLTSAARWVPLARRFAAALQRLHREDAVDLAHFTDAREAAFVRLPVPAIGNVNDCYAAECPDNPFALRRDYSDWMRRWLYYRATAFFERRTYRRLDGIIFNSRYTADRVAARYGLPADAGRIVHKSIDVEAFVRREEEEAAPERVPGRILSVGGNCERKGVHNLVRALPGVVAAVPDAHLVIAGQDEHPAVARTAAGLGVQGRLSWLGYCPRERLWQEYRRASVFAMPSLTEALGMVYVEAAMCRTPVLASRNAGIRELFEEGTLEFCDPRDVADMSRRLIRLLTDAPYANDLVQRARRVAEQCDAEDMLLQTIRCYRAFV